MSKDFKKPVELAAIFNQENETGGIVPNTKKISALSVSEQIVKRGRVDFEICCMRSGQILPVYLSSDGYRE